MRGDASDASADREGDLDHLVERCLIAAGAERANVIVMTDRLQCRAFAKHTAAAGTDDIPRQFKDAKARSVQEGGNDGFLVETAIGGKSDGVDAAQR